MKEMKLIKETYERSSLTITEFSETDAIVTSSFLDDFADLLGDNSTIIVPGR